MAWRRGTAAAFVVTIVLATLWEGAALTGEVALVTEHGYELHPPIFIDGDADLLLDGHGVRSGSGTEDDPYVISRWLIATAPSGPGIRMTDVHTHVVIEDVTVYSMGLTNLIPGYCEPQHLGDCVFGWGLKLVGVSNLTVRNLRLVNTDIALHLDRVTGSHFEGVVIGPDAEGHWGGRSQLGVHALGSSATFKEVEFVGTRRPIEAYGSMLSFDTIVARPEGGVLPEDRQETFIQGGHVEFRDSTFVEQYVRLRGGSAALIGSTLSPASDGWYALFVHENAVGPGVFACGNRFTGSIADANVHVEGGRLHLIANEFVDNLVHLNAEPGATWHPDTRVLLRGNTFGATSSGVTAILASDELAAADNAFLAGRVIVAGGLDVAGNWWGDASGPGGAGSGTGTELDAPTTVTFSPWLTSPPEAGPGSVDCEAERALWLGS